MAYAKINWTTTTARSTANLDHMETQYDQAIAQGESLRADNTKALKTQVAAVAPAGSAGQIYFNSVDKQLYLYDGTAWVHVGPSKIEKLYDVSHDVTSTSTTINLGESFDYLNRAFIYDVKYETGTFSYEAMNMLTWQDDTTILAQAVQSGGGATFRLKIVQYYPGIVKSIQRILVSRFSSSDPNPQVHAISAVDVDKTQIYYTMRGASWSRWGRCWLETSAELRMLIDTGHAARIEIVEFY